MDNIEEMLRALVGEDDDGCEEQNRRYHNFDECRVEYDHDDCGEKNEEQQGLFSGLDPEMLIKLIGLLETLNQPDDTERFLLTLKPLLRKENRPKVDSALRLIKLISLLPILNETGIFDKLI